MARPVSCVSVGLAFISVGDTFMAFDIYTYKEGSLKPEGPPEAKRPYSLVTLRTNVTGAPLTVTASATVMAENVARKKLPSEEPLNNLAKWHSCCPSSREVVSLVVYEGAREMEARIKETSA